MNCIRCEQAAGYNRVVVDVVSGNELGGYCRNCEYEEFGHALERFCRASRTCSICERDGLVGLVAYTPSVDESGDRLVATATSELTDRTPFLCDEHYHAMVKGTSTAVSSAGGQR